MELDDCAFPLLAGIVQTDDADVAFGDAESPCSSAPCPARPAWSAPTCSRPTAPSSAAGQGPRRSAASDVKVLVVGNPANTNSLIAMNNAPDIDPEQFTAMTRLDHNRAISQLATKGASRSPSVTKMTIWGNHSATQYPDLFHGEVDGPNAAELVGDQAWIEDSSSPPCQARRRHHRGPRRSSAASAANAAIDHVRDWVLGTPEGDWVSMAIPSDGCYGVPRGHHLVPVHRTDGGYEIVQGLDIDDFSRGIDASVAELAEERDAVKELGLI